MNNEITPAKVRGFLRKSSRFISVFLLAGLVSGVCVFGEDRLPSTLAQELNSIYDLLAKDAAEEAIARIMAYRKTGKEHYLLSFALGNAYMSAKKYPQARQAYENTVERQKDYAPAWYNMAACDMEMKQYPKAGDAFIKAYELSSEKKPEALYYASNAYLTAEEYQKSIEAFNRLSANHFTDVKPEWKTTLAQAFLALKRPKEALPVIEELSRTTEGKLKLQWQEMLLQQYLSLSMNQKALEYAGKLTEIDPLEPKWWRGLVHINLIMDRYKAALVALTVYSHLTDLSVEEKMLMADLFLSLDIPDQAAVMLEEVLEKQWELKTIEKLVQAYGLSHQREKALALVESGLKRDGNDKDLLWLKGNLLFSGKAYGDAVKVLELLTRNSPDMGRAWLMLGYAAWNENNLATARRAFEKAGHFDAQKKPALDAMKRLEGFGNTR